jgi:acetyl esterase/lipase
MAANDEEMLALLAPEYRAYIEWLRAQSWPPLDQHSVPEARARMRLMQKGSSLPGAVTEERHALDGFSVLILRPVHAQEELLPVVVYFHGGGWVLGDCDTHARMVGEIAVQSRAAVVFVEYARAPEMRFPVPLEQCYRAVAWVAGQGRSLGLDSERIAVAGDSAGGTLASGVSILAARRGGPRIRMQALLYPVMDCDFSTTSYREFETGLNLDLAAMHWFWNHYLPDADLRVQPLASPLRASLDELKSLPPALVITAECDVLRDEGEAYARKLAQAGVSVTSVRFAGTLHAFLMIDKLAQTTQALSAMRLLTSELRQALGVDETRSVAC